MGSRSAAEILQELDKLLAETEWKSPSRNLVTDLAYVKQHKQLRANDTVVQQNIHTIANTVCDMLAARGPTSSPFRLCSVGCGFGGFDKQVLEMVLEKFPKTKLHYVGIEINELSCHEARRTFKPLTEVTTEIRMGDIQQLEMTDLEPCDLVICVNTLYYVTSLDTALRNCLKLVKEKGKLLVINASRNAVCEIYSRFWLHQNGTQLIFSPSIKHTLTAIGIDFSLKCTNKGHVDMTECFQDNFQKPHQKEVLNFLTQLADIDVYPPAVGQLAIDYLYSIAEGLPEKVLVPVCQEVIDVDSV